MAPRKLRRDNTSNSESTEEAAPAPQLPPRDEQPVRTLILPKNASPDAKIVSLANPSNGQLSRYLYCPKTGFYEFTQVGSMGSTPRSCLLVPNDNESAQAEADGNPTEQSSTLGNGYVMEDAQLLIATPMDPKFFFMPLFKPGMVNERGRPHMARMMDDLLDDLGATSAHMEILLRHPSVRKLFDKAMDGIFECVPAMGEILYRPYAMGLLKTLVAKAQAVVNDAWPASLEKYVRKRLEIPAAIAILRQSNQPHRTSQTPDEEKEPSSANVDYFTPQEKTPGESTDRSSIDPNLEPSEDVVKQLRLRTALDFILSSYVPPKMKEYYEYVVASPNCHLVDFQDMIAYLDHVEKMKAEAQKLRSISDNVSRKRSAEDDEEAQDAKAEKRRKKEDEEKKRKQESRATKDLKKVDTKGMKKLSSFFSKGNASKAG